MKLVCVQSEVTATVLQNLVKPGVEVCYIGQEIDSRGIKEIYLITSQGTFQLEMVNNLAARVMGKVVDGCFMKILVV